MQFGHESVQWFRCTCRNSLMAVNSIIIVVVVVVDINVSHIGVVVIGIVNVYAVFCNYLKLLGRNVVH